MAAFRRVAGAAQSILDQATALHPNRSTLSDGTLGDPAHASRDSDHNPDSNGIVHAADLTHDPANGVDAHAWANATRLKVKAGQERRVTYQISNGRIYSANSGWEWVPYTGENPHEHHVHTSVTDGALQDNEAPWFSIGGLTVNQFNTLLTAVRRQSEICQDVTRNQGEMTRQATADGLKALGVATRRAIWRAAGQTGAKVDALDAELEAEFDEQLTAITAVIEADAIDTSSDDGLGDPSEADPG